MKKLLFASYNLDIGGIETSLITLLNYLIEQNKYEITLVLEQKRGIFLEKLNPNIKVIEYKPSEFKIGLIRRGINLLKRIGFTIKHKNKYDFSASYATYSLSSSFVARTSSKHPILWIHTNYYEFFHHNIKEMETFFNQIDYLKFSKLIFVSQKAKDDFENEYLKKISSNQEIIKEKTMLCHNIIKDKQILEKSKEKIGLSKDEIFTFLHVGRHQEEEKKLFRLLEAAEKLKEDNLKFRVILVGDGKDHNTYKEYVDKHNLTKEVIFTGKKENPYPYFKMSDATILTSEFEGYPVVFLESFILGKPIITTDVSDAQTLVKDKNGYIVKKDSRDIYAHMKKMILEGYHPKGLDIKEYNEEIYAKLEKILNP